MNPEPVVEPVRRYLMVKKYGVMVYNMWCRSPMTCELPSKGTTYSPMQISTSISI